MRNRWKEADLDIVVEHATAGEDLLGRGSEDLGGDRVLFRFHRDLSGGRGARGRRRRALALVAGGALARGIRRR